MEESLEVQKKRSKKIVIIFAIAAIFLTAGIIIIAINSGQAVRKYEAKYQIMETKYQCLSDSVKFVTTMVTDTVYPVLTQHENYLASVQDTMAACKSYVNSRLTLQKKEVLSYVNAKLKKADNNIEAFRSNQVSFAKTFDNDLKLVKNNLDTLKIKTEPLVLPKDTSKTNVVSDDEGVKNKKKLRFGKIFGKPTSDGKGW
jgi:hypothetical protein